MRGFTLLMAHRRVGPIGNEHNSYSSDRTIQERSLQGVSISLRPPQRSLVHA